MIEKDRIMEDPGPKDVFLVDNLETLRVLSDPLRIQILELLLYHPWNVKQIAQQLGIPPSRLYYHVKLLEEHGLIHVVDTHLVSGIVEKVYRATAGEIILAKDLLPVGSSERRGRVESLLNSVLDSTKEDFKRSIAIKEVDYPDIRQTATITRDLARLRPEQAQAFCQKLRELAKEFSDLDLINEEGGQQFALTMIFYPSYQRSPEGEMDE
jgi:DNA-binding transcriptional ArsR family regulator